MSESRYCVNCGNQISHEAEICSQCGFRQPARKMKYCTNCGNQIDFSVEICPECDFRQPARKMKYCTNCGSQIDEKAEICPECGVRQATEGTYQEKRSHQVAYQEKNPLLAAILSILIVGLGQLYNGQIIKAIVLFVLAIISAFLWSIIIGIAFSIIIWVYAAFDAYVTAQRINNGEIVGDFGSTH